MTSRLIIFILVSFCIAVNFGNPQPIQKVTILDQNFTNLLKKGYNFFYSLSDGQKREEAGSYDDGKLKIIGSYSYQGDDNKKYLVKYTADENGYNAKTQIEEAVVTVPPPPILQISPAAIAALSG